MSNTRKKYSKRYFKNIILLTTLTIITFIILTSYFIYISTKQTITQNKYQTDTQMLSQVKHALEKHNLAVRKLCMELYYNADANMIMNNNWDPSYSPQIEKKLLDIETVTLTLNPYIHSIYFYNEKTRNIYSAYCADGVVVKDVFLMNLLAKYANPPVLQPLLRKINVIGSGVYETEYVFSYIMSNSMTGYNGNGSAAIINIRPEYFLTEVQSIIAEYEHPGDFFALVTEAGTWFPDREIPDINLFIEQLKRVYLSRIMLMYHQGSKLGIITEKLNEAQYFISFIKIGGTELTIVKTQPYEAVFTHLMEITYSITLITAVIILAAILVSIILSSRIYKPIGQLMQLVDENTEFSNQSAPAGEMDFLRNVYLSTIRALRETQARYYNESDMRKQNFWTHLVKGAISREDVDSVQKETGASLDLFSPFYLWLIKIDNNAKFHDISRRDYYLYKYAVGNIMEEIISKKFSLILFDAGTDSFAVLLAYSSAENPDPELTGKYFRELAAEGQSAVLRHLEMSISISVSGVIQDYSELPSWYNEVERNIQYRVLYGHMCFITPQMVKLNNEYAPFAYPFALEESFLQEIRHGNLTEAEAYLDDLIAEIHKMDYDSIIISIIRMCNMAYDTLIDLCGNNFVPIPDSLEIVGVSSLEQYSIHDISSRMWSEIEKIVLTVRETAPTGKRNVLMQTISALIKSNYRDPDFCLALIAETLDMAPNYIGSLYKENTGKSIAQSILDMRLKKAEELIVTTDYTIGRIIELTGFLNESSFYKNFKKQYGTTPNNYKLRQKVNQREPSHSTRLRQID